MENNELFNQIKSAAKNDENKDFPELENVWNRVEQKLDKKEDKKAIWRWKKIAVAASLLLFATLGYQFFKNNPNDSEPNEVVAVTDSIKKITPQNDIVITEPKADSQLKTTTLNPAIKKEAELILQQQLNPVNQVALEEETKSKDKITLGISTNQMGYSSAPIVLKAETDSDADFAYKSKKADTNDIELFMNKNSKVERKEDPLVIMDNKVVKEKLENIEFSAADSLVVLNDPLYIINGQEFTEQQVFGPNPTSPYTPIHKQDIETISILQNEKAIEVYGKKGTKGVVIITIRKKMPATKTSTSKKEKQ